jgi:hypothetical protein
VFGLDAKELFFQEDSVILTEGQEDVVMYPQVLSEIGRSVSGHFFGWGVGAAADMSKIVRVLEDLGFRKVVGLLDNDKVEQLERLRKEFPRYFFDVIPAKDIRTKPAQKAKEAVYGLLDEKGKIREEFKKETEVLFDRIEAHLKNDGNE